jgi:hypothetical protein
MHNSKQHLPTVFSHQRRDLMRFICLTANEIGRDADLLIIGSIDFIIAVGFSNLTSSHLCELLIHALREIRRDSVFYQREEEEEQLCNQMMFHRPTFLASPISLANRINKMP